MYTNFQFSHASGPSLYASPPLPRRSGSSTCPKLDFPVWLKIKKRKTFFKLSSSTLMRRAAFNDATSGFTAR